MNRQAHLELRDEAAEMNKAKANGEFTADMENRFMEIMNILTMEIFNLYELGRLTKDGEKSPELIDNNETMAQLKSYHESWKAK